MKTIVQSNDEDYQSFFKNLYYDLYSNSNTSRAERIVSDITKLLLCKLMIEQGTNSFLNEDNYDANVLLSALKSQYPKVCDQFDDFSLSNDTIHSILQSMNQISLLHAPGHIIGDAFQAIIGPKVRGDKGQFFTPKALVDCMVNILSPLPHEIIMDPACGTGGFLNAAYLYQRNKTEDQDYKGTIIGIDKDKDMADITLALTEIITGGKSEVYTHNSLELLDPQNELNKLLGTIDVVLTNPPFGSKIGVTDKNILKNFEFGYNWAYSDGWYKLNHIAKSQDPQVLFLELCVKLLRKGGRMGIVLPEGIFGNRSLGYIWDFLKKYGNVFAMIDCPRNTFQPSTDTKTNVLFFEKTDDINHKVWVSVAKNCGHDKRGRITTSNGNPVPNDFLSIAQFFLTREKVLSDVWQKSELNGEYYVPRYHYNKLSTIRAFTKDNSVSLGELIKSNILTIRSGHEVGSDAYGTGNIPFVRTSDINNFEISSDPTNSISDDIYMQYKKSQKLKCGDVLFIADGRYRIGKSAILNEFNLKCVVQSHIDILSLAEAAPFSPYEFFYILNMSQVQEQIRNLIFIQSTLGTLGNRIREIRLPLPERTQNWITLIEAFQAKIETRAKLLAELKDIEQPFDL